MKNQWLLFILTFVYQVNLLNILCPNCSLSFWKKFDLERVQLCKDKCLKSFITLYKFKIKMEFLVSGISEMVGTLHAGGILPLDHDLFQAAYKNMEKNSTLMLYPPTMVLQ